jgi:hypothetical protein
VTLGGTKSVAFVTTSARKRPMAVLRNDISALFRDSQGRSDGNAGDLAKWVSDYRAKSVFPVEPRSAADEVQSVKLSAKGKELALARSQSGGWQFVEPKGWGDADVAGADTPDPNKFTGVRPLLNALTGLSAQSADDFIEQPKDLKEYGLNPDNPDRVRVELKPKDGPPVVVFVGKKAETEAPKGLPGMQPPPANKVFVQVEGESGVVRASGANIDGIAAAVADPSTLRDRTLLHTDKDRIDAIDVVIGGQTVKLRKPGGSLESWKLYGGPGDPQPAARQAVEQLLDVLTEKRAIKDFPARNDANFAGPELKAEVKVWTDGIESDPKADPKAEPKLKGNPTTLRFGKKEGDSVYVRRVLPGGPETDFTLPETVSVKVGGAPTGTPTNVLAAVARTRLDLLDPELKSFSEFLANRLTITKGGQTTEITREEKSSGGPAPGGWKYTQPEAMKGKEADAAEAGELLRFLASQKAVRFIDEQPDEKKLAEYGLDPKGPVMRVAVGLKPPGPPGTPPPADADKERVYEFGKDTPDGHVYARQQGRAAVFTLPKEAFNRFATADLRDKTVVKFDPAKVTGLRLRGWFAVNNFVTTLEFERKGSEWVAKTPAGFNVDPAKVTAFLGLISGLQAKAFVPGPQKPEYGLPPEQQGLEITVLLEGRPGIALNIGGPAEPAATSFYGWTNDPSAGGSVFTVLAERFKPYKDKPAAFAK